MSVDFFNVLHVMGEGVSDFFDFISKKSDLGEYFVSLEQSCEGIDEIDIDLRCDSQGAWKDTFDIDVKRSTISWNTPSNPSLFSVYKLSEEFPTIHFVFEFENTEEELAGYIGLRDGCVLYKYFVNFEDGALSILLDNYGHQIMSLRKGDKIEVGLGMVEIECTSEQDTERELIKKFNVVFQCDSSPKIILYIPKEKGHPISLDMDFMNGYWRIDEIDYSDDAGNVDILDNTFHGEMCMHCQKTPYPPLLQDG